MYIGEQKIKTKEETDEKTPSGIALIKVTYDDGSQEMISDLLYEKLVSKKPCDATELRDKRVVPIVQVVLTLLRDWGIKLGELEYFSALLTRSLDYNKSEAEIELWSKWMNRPNSPQDVTLLTIDRVLKEKKKTLKDVTGK